MTNNPKKRKFKQPEVVMGSNAMAEAQGAQLRLLRLSEAPDVDSGPLDKLDAMLADNKGTRAALYRLLQEAWEEGQSAGYDDGFSDAEEECDCGEDDASD
jgi:flagellar biosynthesis/type III secretory pathway protein FliH